jgi:hypothetical protein
MVDEFDSSAEMNQSPLFALGFLATTLPAWGGPPFATDDPEPVEYRHWEVYFASQYAHGPDGTAGTLPHLEVNYGLVPNLQIHLIAPAAFAAPAEGSRHYGYGDTELGAKYRFVEETDLRPQIGVFPLVELATGDSQRGLGGGHTQVFLPVWLQKSSGPWVTYGGGGYWINPGADNRNWWFMGWLIQRQLRPGLAVGVEVFHETAQSVGGRSDTKMNIGVTWDLSETRHLLASFGPVLQGASGYQAYFAFQLTLRPGQ